LLPSIDYLLCRSRLNLNTTTHDTSGHRHTHGTCQCYRYITGTYGVNSCKMRARRSYALQRKRYWYRLAFILAHHYLASYVQYRSMVIGTVGLLCFLNAKSSQMMRTHPQRNFHYVVVLVPVLFRKPRRDRSRISKLVELVKQSLVFQAFTFTRLLELRNSRRPTSSPVKKVKVRKEK
jgi:hypothetical protein